MLTQEDIEEVSTTPTNKPYIEVVEVQEHEDGSATYTFDMDEKTSKATSELGLKFLLYLGVTGMTPDKVFDLMLKEVLNK